MELLSDTLVPRETGERVFRHGVTGPLVMCGLFVSPLPLALHARAELLDALSALPWPAWLVLAPMALVCGSLWLLCLHAVGQVAYRALLPSNWLMRVSAAGLVLNLRSYQNAHFPSDGPTAVRLAWPEITGARKVVERHERRGRRGHETLERKSWIELELATTATAEIEGLVAAERMRPGPERSCLGIRGRTRSNHVPVFVERPGVLRVDWVGGGMLRALERHIALGPKLTVDLDRQPGDLDTRLRALLARGNRFAAFELARRELGLSPTEAKRRVDEIERKAA